MKKKGNLATLSIYLLGLVLGGFFALLSAGGLLAMFVAPPPQAAMPLWYRVATILLFFILGLSGFLAFFLRRLRIGRILLGVFGAFLLLNLLWIPLLFLTPPKWLAFIPLFPGVAAIWILTILTHPIGREGDPTAM